ncbi:DUF4230 domain-containing protein [Runella rosea]|uniref:DUF4230 domain-containing protein n=2 Tax=Runella TaxID=105 RepID=A0A344TQJ9_9BACT|nr:MULTISPECIES: DUF4230 domain-containing protein [Runella]AXE20920.1 DUF4230 domain-containing protein [Runella rosea]MCP1385707.1 DUF4230 domain-containing protein [Runella salmonicolor]
MGFSSLIFFIITLVLGGSLGFGIFYVLTQKQNANKQLVQSSTILLERIEKVFKVVMAEGYFTEIFDYKDDKTYWYLFKNSKKALVIAKAKVLVGFDFAKMRYRIDEKTNKMVVEYFPDPEVLSIDTDYKFYDIENGLWNRFNQEDYTNLLVDAKQAMNEKALTSDLPRIANNQVQFMMYQLAASMGWNVDMQLPPTNQQKLEEFKIYEEVKAEVKELGEGEAGKEM